MAQLYQCMHFSIGDFMRYGRIVPCKENTGPNHNGADIPAGVALQLDARYLTQVFRRESAAAEACAIASGRFYASDPARQYDLRDLLLSCRVGSYQTFEPDVRESIPGPGGRLYNMDAVLQLLFLQGIRVVGLRSRMAGCALETDVVVFRSFLRSASMSRGGELSFAAQEICDRVLDHCSLGLLQQGQDRYPWAAGSGVLLSKFEAYMGLALSDAAPVRQLPWQLNEETVVVVSDTVFSRYQRQELLRLENKDNVRCGRSLTRAAWPHGCCWEPDENGILQDELIAAEYGELTPFDGEGILTPAAAADIRRSLHLGEEQTAVSSFQIRMPLCKGVLHAVDFQGWLQSGDSGFAPDILETEEGLFIRDLYECKRDLRKARILLTESMFKCHKWVADCAAAEGECDPMRWYFARLHSRLQLPYGVRNARKPAALWICRCNKTAAQQGDTTLTNYQILHTTGFDLDTHMELAAASVQQYADLARTDAIGDAVRYARYAVQDLQPDAETDEEGGDPIPAWLNCSNGTGELWLRRSMAVMPQLLYTTRARYSMRSWSESYRKDTQAGRLEVRGATRLLSADLMTFLWALGINAALTAARIGPHQVRRYALQPTEWELGAEEYDAPCTTAAPLTLGDDRQLAGAAFFRNPHMSREEHLLLRSFADAHDDAAVQLRRKYLAHLEGVVMLAARSMGAARLSGADFDGDIVRVITEPAYVQGLYHSLARAQQEMGLTPAPEQLLPCLPLVNIKKQSGHARKVTEDWLRERGRHTLHYNEYRMWDEARRNNVGHFSNLGVNFGAAAYGIAAADETEKQRADRVKAETYVRRLTALVGYEIDSTKTGFKPTLPPEMEIVSRNYQPFLKYNSAARKYRKANIYTYYPGELRRELAGKTAREGAQLLAGAGSKTGWQACWLNLLPWYLYRAGGEALGKLETAEPAVAYTAAQLRQALGLGGFAQWDEASRKLFLQLTALCRAWQDSSARKEDPASGAKEQIVRSLFMQQPQQPVEQLRQQAEQLIETLKAWYLQTEDKQTAQQAAEAFRRQVSAPEFLLSRGEERARQLQAVLKQLHRSLAAANDADEEIEAFVRLCARTERDGYRIPLLAAIGAEEWLNDSTGFDLTKACAKAEAAEERLQQLCAMPVDDAALAALTTAFTAVLARCRTTGERLQQLRALQQRLLGAALPDRSDSLLAAMALSCADQTAVTAQQLQAAGLQAAGVRAVLGTIAAESNTQRFLWDCAGPALYRTILRVQGTPSGSQPDFALLRAQLTRTGGEPA